MRWIAGCRPMLTAPVNKIIPFSNVDGPGNRTSIFFQGCPFNCLFCHNPETIHLCRNCGACVKTCPAGALYQDPDGTVHWDASKCVQCDTCIKTCPHDASPKVRWMTVEEVMREVKRAAPYIRGITTSGGECTLQNEFLIELFTRARAMGKTCLIDSNGSFDFENLDYLLRVGKLYEVRTILFPGRDRENEETVRYVAAHIRDGCFYKLIRYRPFGVRERYQKLLGEDETDAEYAESFARLARELGAEKAYIV